VNSVGSGEGPVAGSCEHNDEPSGSGATESVSIILVYNSQKGLTQNYRHGLRGNIFSIPNAGSGVH
jgi:hypothetical protein